MRKSRAAQIFFVFAAFLCCSIANEVEEETDAVAAGAKSPALLPTLDGISKTSAVVEDQKNLKTEPETAEPNSEVKSTDGNTNPTSSIITAINQTDGNNDTSTSWINTTVPTTTTKEEALPGKGSAEKEHQSSMAIFFILFIIVLSILLIHVILVTKFHYVPESLAIVVLGAVIGLILNFSERDWTQEEAFSPNAFFLLLLPPIIFEGGYNLHKGNFFANIGSILVFAIVGTAISAFIIGGGIYILGQADLIYELNAVESFAFGSMISAVDPVATLAIFQALSVDPILYMLVFGESMLNDAVAIVLTTTVLELNAPDMKDVPAPQAILMSVGRFCVMFFGSALIGVCAGLMSSLLLKHVDLRKTPSLELSIMLVFAYLPYGLAEGIHLSGIMAILFCGISMSHYTHMNLSPVTQITIQQTFRTLAFIAETCVFAYLGMAFFTFKLIFKPVFVIWSIVLCLVSRAFNIFPLSFLVNMFREHKITNKMQFVMWFSGLRGAIAFALVIHMEFSDDNDITRRMMITSTLSIVVFSIMILGGGTLPLIRFLNREQRKENNSRRKRRSKRRKRKRKTAGLSLSKTQELGETVEPDMSYSEYGTEVDEISPRSSKSKNNSGESSTQELPSQLKGLAKLDASYFRPFFIRKFTLQEKKESTLRLTDMALQWYKDVQEESASDEETKLLGVPTVNGKNLPSVLSDSNFSLGIGTPATSETDTNDKQPLIPI